jgi:FkbM family methyltransferase
MGIVRSTARTLRNAPILRDLDAIWSALGPVYFWALDPFGRGQQMRLSGDISVIVPSRFSGVPLETYEPEAFVALAAWMRQNPGARIIDIGCSIGALSVAALFIDSRAEVIAIDSNIASLLTTQEMCSKSSGDRLILLHGLVSNEPSVSFTVARERTQSVLSSITLKEAYKHRYDYICLDSPYTDDIPRLRLDDLFSDWATRPILLKCDVEGAEHLVIAGARAFLARDKPALLLSVHPVQLRETYQHSADELRDTIIELGYDIELLAVDHEEHWLCVASDCASAKVEIIPARCG